MTQRLAHGSGCLSLFRRSLISAFRLIKLARRLNPPAPSVSRQCGRRHCAPHPVTLVIPEAIVAQELVVAAREQDRLNLSRLHIHYVKPGESPADVVGPKRAGWRHFDQHAPNLAIGIKMSNGWQRNDSDPMLWGNIVRTVRFPAHQSAINVTCLLRQCLF
jgi:hypothetical protein